MNEQCRQEVKVELEKKSSGIKGVVVVVTVKGDMAAGDLANELYTWGCDTLVRQ